MRRRWLIVLVGLFFAASPSAALACSCVQSTKGQQAQGASFVFAGTVTGMSRPFTLPFSCTVSSADPVSVTFTVDAVYKGDVAKRVVVRTALSGASCGYEFAVGKRYTVFATDNAAGYETNLCRGNVEGAITPSEYGVAEGRAPRG